MVLAGHQRVISLPRDIVRLGILLARGAGIRVVHARAMEEVRIDRTRLQRRDGDAGVLQLIPQAVGKAQHKRLGRRIHRLARSHHLARHRRRKQNAS